MFFVKNIVESYSIKNSVAQAQQMTNQLMVLRSYLADISSKFKIVDKDLNDFALTPAFVGGHISKEMGEKYAFYIKQTSLDYRNPSNIPDAYEKQLLKQYAQGDIEGEHWEVSKQNGQDALRYTKPLYIEPDCMKCHGEPHVDVEW